jgi:hypothetical protein
VQKSNFDAQDFAWNRAADNGRSEGRRVRGRDGTLDHRVQGRDGTLDHSMRGFDGILKD